MSSINCLGQTGDRSKGEYVTNQTRRSLVAMALVSFVAAGCGAGVGQLAGSDSVGADTATAADVENPGPEDPSGGRVVEDASEVDPSTGPVVQDVGITVYAAADLDPAIRTWIDETLHVARDAWGLRWALEYWVFGTDPDAAVALVEEFCTLRDTLRQWDADECFAREAGPDQHSMLSYQQLSADALARGEPMNTAGWNGSPEWTMHRFASSAPWGLVGEFGIPADDDLKTVFHEYWHAVQSQHLDADLPREMREELMGPVWFVEGSAEYMAQYQRARARAGGLLPDVPAGDYPFIFSEQMQGKLGIVDEELAGNCSGRRLITIERYDDPCSFLGYDMGAWAIAYLESITEPDVLLRKFHPRVQDLGWLAAFEATAGMTLEEFDAEFHDFIIGATDARMAILPDVGDA